MTRPMDPLFDERVAEWLHGDPDSAPGDALEMVLTTFPSVPQQRVVHHVPRRFPTMSMPTRVAAAVVVAMVALGGAFFVAGPSPSAKTSTSPSLPAVAVPSVTPTAKVSPSPESTSLNLTWTQVALDKQLGRVAWLGDRFVLIDDAGAVSTSTDGSSWQVLQPGDYDPGYFEMLTGRAKFVSWQDNVVSWWNPEDGASVTNKPPVTARDILRIVRPSAVPTDTSPFKGRIESIGVGPAGIVAQVHSHLDWDAWVASKLGDNWVSHYTGVDFKDGILTIGMDNGPGLEVVWADEGFEPGDYMDAGFGWYSSDGEQWTPMPASGSPGSDGFLGFPTGFGDVVGVADGFIARGDGPEDSCALPDGCSNMWHSSDGLTWRNLGSPSAVSSGEMLPWKGGVLVTDGVGGFYLWTSQGPTELPMAAELPAAWTQASEDNTRFGTGPLGLVTVRRGVQADPEQPRPKDDQEILFTRDGVAWDIQAMPAEMEADQTSFYGWANVVVGERSVLVVLLSGTDTAPIRTLWLGTPEP